MATPIELYRKTRYLPSSNNKTGILMAEIGPKDQKRNSSNCPLFAMASSVSAFTSGNRMEWNGKKNWSLRLLRRTVVVVLIVIVITGQKFDHERGSRETIVVIMFILEIIFLLLLLLRLCFIAKAAAA